MTARAEHGQSAATAGQPAHPKADAVTFVLTTATSYINYHDISGDPAAQCEKILAGLRSGKDYAALRSRHEADFRGLMGRVHLNVGDAAQNDKPIEERLAAVKAGTRDPNLEALVFQLGRYILAASSRAGGQPANLAGHLGRRRSSDLGQQIHHQHQHGDELLARRKSATCRNATSLCST